MNIAQALIIALSGMTFQDGLIAALLFVVGFCGTLLKIIWDRSKACEANHAAMETVLRDLGTKVGILQGTLNVMSRCPVTSCPYRPHIIVAEDEDVKH